MDPPREEKRYHLLIFPTGHVNSPDRLIAIRLISTAVPLRCPRLGTRTSVGLRRQEAHAMSIACAFQLYPRAHSYGSNTCLIDKVSEILSLTSLPSLMNPLMFHSSRPCQTHGPHVPRATDSLHSFIETQLEGRRGVGFQYPAPCIAFSPGSGVLLGSEQRLLLLSFYGTTATW